MKYYFLIFFFALSNQLVYSQTIVDGYYINLDNDSVSVKIKVPKLIFSGVDIERLERKVKSVDSSGQMFQKFKPDKIKGFGFNYKNKLYRFVARPVKESHLKFFEIIYVGNKESAYYYYKTGNKGAKHEIVIVEKENGEDLILKNSMSRKKIKNRLQDFFKDIPVAQQIIQTESISRTHLENSVKEIIESINKS